LFFTALLTITDKLIANQQRADFKFGMQGLHVATYLFIQNFCIMLCCIDAFMHKHPWNAFYGHIFI